MVKVIPAFEKPLDLTSPVNLTGMFTGGVQAIDAGGECLAEFGWHVAGAARLVGRDN